MADAHDQLAVLFHLVDKLHGQHAAVERFAELLRGCIQSSSKTIPLEFMNKSFFQYRNNLLTWTVKDKRSVRV